jgi:D-sedoheptulose 7-phosphate isomerase
VAQQVPNDAAALARRRITESIEVKRRLLDEPEALHCITDMAAAFVRACRDGGKVVFLGNGGSAADAQHLAAEFTGRFVLDRRPLPAIALATNGSITTAIANDYSFEDVFRREIEALVEQRDVVVAISTSGRSANVLRACETARARGATTIGWTGEHGRQLASRVDHCLRVPSADTARIQEVHMTVGHVLCEFTEAMLCA